ncbi:DUF4157 domain-containing protein [Pendulispora rubella]|uniref:DUF4157 domain-containing protein n=1 Tax=Pendulispora rubella TaxID=2741070 RepID=A0ABZ2L1C8_9BACT
MSSGRMLMQRSTPAVASRVAREPNAAHLRRATLDSESAVPGGEPYAGRGFAHDFSAVPAHGTPFTFRKQESNVPSDVQPVQRACAACSGGASPCPTCDEESTQQLSVQRTALRASALPTDDRGPKAGPTRIHAAAARGTSGPSGSLPFLEQIQRSFGRHDVSQVRAHRDSAAAAGAAAMGAEAFATGNHVAFAGNPSLRTAAHEAAHVIQQRGGVQLHGGVGQEDDAYERHADAVAELVVQGKSSEALLDAYAGDSPAGPSRPVVMRKELFSSTVNICRRLLKSRDFKVSQGGLAVSIEAFWHGPEDGASSCASHRSHPYNVTLSQSGLLRDPDYGTCEFDPQRSSTRIWKNLPPSADYYLTIWTNNTNPNCCLDGDIRVSEDANLTGESCTVIPDSALEILHGALDIAGLIPALGAIPDGINAGIYLIEGDWTNAGLSAAAMVPIFGEGVTLTKRGIRVTRAAISKAGKETIEQGLKNAVKEGEKLAEKGAKEAEKAALEAEKVAKKEGAEKAAKEGTGKGAKEAEKEADEAAKKDKKEKNKGGKWTCYGHSAVLQIPSALPEFPCPFDGQYVDGPPMSAPSEDAACLAAKHAFNAMMPRGCRPKHLACRCTKR